MFAFKVTPSNIRSIETFQGSGILRLQTLDVHIAFDTSYNLPLFSTSTVVTDIEYAYLDSI